MGIFCSSLSNDRIELGHGSPATITEQWDVATAPDHDSELAFCGEAVVAIAPLQRDRHARRKGRHPGARGAQRSDGIAVTSANVDPRPVESPRPKTRVPSRAVSDLAPSRLRRRSHAGRDARRVGTPTSSRTRTSLSTPASSASDRRDGSLLPARSGRDALLAGLSSRRGSTRPRAIEGLRGQQGARGPRLRPSPSGGSHPPTKFGATDRSSPVDGR